MTLFKRNNPYFIWKNGFIVWNLVALIFVKAIFSYSGLELTSLISGLPTFSKEEVIAQTNVLRSASGLNTLNENPALDLAAAQKLQDMIQGQYFAHTSPAGINPWHWIEVNKYSYTYAGENLAIGFLTAADTVNAWANSPSHRENLLNFHYKEIGIAVASTKIRGSEGILVVQLFGTPSPLKKTVVATLRPAKITASVKPSATIKPTASSSPKPSNHAVSQTPGLTKAAESSFDSPVTVTLTKTSPTFDRVSKALNSAFAIYSLLVLLASIILVVFVEARRGFIFRTAVSLTLVVLSVALPVMHISLKALIV